MNWLPPSMPFDLWPDVDQLAWREGVSGDPLAPSGGGQGAAWRPSTARHVERGYGRWLAWLELQGALDRELSPDLRAPRPQVRRYLDDCEAAGLADYSRAGRLQALADALRIMRPQADVHFIARAAGRISAAAVRARDLRSKLRDPAEVLEFGRALMRAGEDERTAPFERALLFRDGLIISLWSLRALRIANLAGICIDQQLMTSGEGRRLQFTAAEMKAKRPFFCAWPPSLEPALERYLTHHRLQLRGRDASGQPDDGLWISQFGRRMRQASVAQMLRQRTGKRFEEALNPHLMRHMVATTVAENRPEDIADVPAMLAHADLETSEKHYILASSVQAATAFQAILLGRSI